MATIKCTQCGTELKDGEKVCPVCGNEHPTGSDEKVVPPSAYYPDPQPVYASPIYDSQPPKNSRYALISTAGFIGSFLLLAIPVIGWIFCIVWACGGCKNYNRRNLARAILILWLLLVLALVLVGLLYWFVLVPVYGWPFVSNFSFFFPNI